MYTQRTLILIKPDGVQRCISGKIMDRFESAGLKIVGMKMVWADDNLAKTHYPLDEQWAKNLFEKTKAAYAKDNKPVKFKDHIEMGQTIQGNLIDFLKEGPVIAMVLEGQHAIELVRKLIGSTEPRQSAPGTIRGDFASIESYAKADSKSRAVRNLVHASDSPENAKREIAVWFKESEIHSYKSIYDFLSHEQ
jgi:nucleoside-diphosphate kinase